MPGSRNRQGLHAVKWIAILVPLLISSCGDSENGPKPDTIPPGAVLDLAVADTAATSIGLSWTAPAEDGSSGGPAAFYDLRFGPGGIDGEWDLLEAVEGEPAPASPGTRQTARVDGLEPDSLYAFALRSIDDAALLSPVSNVVIVRTKADPFPPGAVADLRALAVRADSAHLGWSAPAENGSSGGRVAAYDLRFRLQGLDEGVWDRAQSIEGEPTPAEPGSPESLWVGGLEPGTRYAFGIKSRDSGGLESGLSNVAFVSTAPPPDTVPPAAVFDLEAIELHSTTARLRWTATGDDRYEGRAAAYDLRYRVGEIDEILWDEAIRVEGLPPPSNPGAQDQADVFGLFPELTYSFALRVIDESGNRSDLSNVEEVVTPPPIPLFIDPRGIAGDPSSREIYVADHGDSTVYRLSQDGSKIAIATIPGVLAIVREDALRSYATATGSPGTGSIWRHGGSSSQPIRLTTIPISPVDLAIGGDGNLVVSGAGSGAWLLRYRPLTGLLEEVLPIDDGEPAGVVVDSDGNICFGVNRAQDAFIRRRAPGGGVEDLHELGPGRICGDLTLDPDGQSVWYIDLLGEAVIRVSPAGLADTLATDLDEPTVIAAGPGPSIYYCNRRGFVLIREIGIGRDRQARGRVR